MRKYIETGRRLYDRGLRPWRTSFGWAKESRDEKAGRGEANNTRDLIEAALLLGQSGHPQYFGDAERFIRNGLLACQIVNTDWIAEADGTPDTEDYLHGDVRRRALGAFSFTTPNGCHSYITDLVDGALQSLCEAWEAILTEDQAGWHVNLFLSRETEALELRSRLPEEGRLEIMPHRPRPVFIRLPTWLDRKSLRVQVKGAARPPAFLREELFLPEPVPGDRVEVTFPQARPQGPPFSLRQT